MPNMDKDWNATTLNLLLNGAAPEDGHDIYTDPGQKGLMLRHTGKGQLRFYVRYSVRGQGQKTAPLGE